MSHRRIMRRTLNHSRERRGFRQRQILKLLAKEDSRGFLNTANGNSTALAQVDLVALERKNIVLRKATLQGDCQHRF